MKKKNFEKHVMKNGSKDDLEDMNEAKNQGKLKNMKRNNIRKIKKIDNNMNRKFLKKVENN